MGGSCPERLDKNKLALYKNVLSFNRQHRKDYYKLLENSNVTVFRSRKQVREFLK